MLQLYYNTTPSSNEQLLSKLAGARERKLNLVAFTITVAPFSCRYMATHHSLWVLLSQAALGHVTRLLKSYDSPPLIG